MIVDFPTKEDFALSDAQTFLHRIKGLNRKYVFRAIEDNPKRKQAKIKTFYGTFAQQQGNLTKYNAKGYGIFVVINHTKGQDATADKITHGMALWQDADSKLGLDTRYPETLVPDMVIETSLGNFHSYLFLKPVQDMDGWQYCQDLMTAKLGNDPAACLKTQVLRLPGFLHQKGEPFLVQIVGENNAPRHELNTLKDVLEALPTLPGLEEAEANTEQESDAEALLKYGEVDYASFHKGRLVTLMSALEAIPSEDLDDRDLYVNIGFPLRRLDIELKKAGNSLAGAGKKLWLSTAERSEKFDPAEAEVRWKGLRPDRSDYRALFELATKEYGWKNSGDGLPNGEQRLTASQLIERYVYDPSEDRVWCKTTKAKYTWSGFRNKISSESETGGNNAYKIWVYNKVNVEGSVFAPGQEPVFTDDYGRLMFNYAVLKKHPKTTKTNLLFPFFKHVCFLCRSHEPGRKSVRRDYLDAFAQDIVKPHIKKGFAVVHIAKEEGTGRGLMTEVAEGLLHEDRVHVSPSPRTLAEDGWTGKLKDKVIVDHDEVTPDDFTPRVCAFLRGLATGKRLDVNTKGGSTGMVSLPCALWLEANGQLTQFPELTKGRRYMSIVGPDYPKQKRGASPEMVGTLENVDQEHYGRLAERFHEPEFLAQLYSWCERYIEKRFKEGLSPQRNAPITPERNAVVQVEVNVMKLAFERACERIRKEGIGVCCKWQLELATFLEHGKTMSQWAAYQKGTYYDFDKTQYKAYEKSVPLLKSNFARDFKAWVPKGLNEKKMAQRVLVFGDAERFSVMEKYALRAEVSASVRAISASFEKDAEQEEEELMMN